MTGADSSFIEGSVLIPPLFSVVKKAVNPNESFVKKASPTLICDASKKDMSRMHRLTSLHE